MTTVCVIQARFSSSRLPGKVLEAIGATTMLAKVIERVRRANSLDEIIVATTDEASDDPVAAAASDYGVGIFRGAQYDVLDRYLGAIAHLSDDDTVVRITADCPFIDPEILDGVVEFFVQNGFDFAANRLPPPYERTFPVGLDVEVARVSALRAAGVESQFPHHREHVMPYLYESGERFSFGVLQLDEDLSAYRWTVDTPEDLAAVRALDVLAGKEPYSWREVLRQATTHPEINEINAAHQQKDVAAVDSRWDGNSR